MLRKTLPVLFIIVLALAAVGAVSANPGKPSFAANLYADGETWGSWTSGIRSTGTSVREG